MMFQVLDPYRQLFDVEGSRLKEAFLAEGQLPTSASPAGRNRLKPH
jgi:hypothetical protein